MNFFFIFFRSVSQLNLCRKNNDDDFIHKGNRSHCEKFNALNHPLMAIDCRGKGNTDSRSNFSAVSDGDSCQLPSGVYSKYEKSTIKNPK